MKYSSDFLSTMHPLPGPGKLWCQLNELEHTQPCKEIVWSVLIRKRAKEFVENNSQKKFKIHILCWQRALKYQNSLRIDRCKIQGNQIGWWLNSNHIVLYWRIEFLKFNSKYQFQWYLCFYERSLVSFTLYLSVWWETLQAAPILQI